MPSARQLLRTRKPSGAGAHPRDPPARATPSQMRHDPAFLPAAIDDGAFDRLDGHGVVVDVQCTRRLAWCGADAARELGKVVGRMQRAERRLPLVAVDEVVPVRDQIVDGAAAVTERY